MKYVASRSEPIPDRDRDTAVLRNDDSAIYPAQTWSDGALMKPLIIGVAGGSGSGKSTVARNVAQALQAESVAFIDMDAYYRNHGHLSLPERRKVNWDHPDAFDWELLIDQLARLSAGESVEKPVYDFVSHSRSENTVVVPPAQVVVE